MIIFFDIGQKGAISFFEERKLIKSVIFQLDNRAKKAIKIKLLELNKVLKKYCPQPELITEIGLFSPFGQNRKTIINLAMMNAVIISYFINQKISFLHEWKVWLTLLKRKKIPERALKKSLTISWAQKKFQINSLNDDQADAILGGYYLSKKTERTKKD